MKKRSLLLAALFVAATPLAAMAMNMEHGGHGGAHGQAMQEGHGGGHAEMAMLGAQEKDGVKASAHLNDIKEAMAKMGMKETHHFMVFFEEAGTGKSIETGTVALKIKGPDGKEGGPVALMGMQGHFGADIALPEKGQYEFTVGAKLPDGKTRQFEFSHQVK